jgi:hypothetical protein
VTRDVTSYFSSNFGSGASQTCQVGVAIATATASNVTNIACKLFVTFEYDDSGQSTLVKTVRIPIESLTAGKLTDTLTEIGTNQVPDLDDFFPETTKSYKHIWFEVWACEASSSTSSFNLALALDSEGEATRATLTQDKTSSPGYWDIWVRNDLATSSAHAFKARVTVTNRMCLSCVLHVTYTYASSSTTVINSLLLPWGEPDFIEATTSSYTIGKIFSLNIQEPSTITLVQSGFLMQGLGTAAITISASAKNGGTAQSYRTYSMVSSYNAGGMVWCAVQRMDSGSAVGAIGALSRGLNYISIRLYASTVQKYRLNGFLFLNYTSGVASGGEGSHNHSVKYGIGVEYDGTVVGVDSSSIAPNIPEASYYLSRCGMEVMTFGTTVGNELLDSLSARLQSGEGFGALGEGWIRFVRNYKTGGTNGWDWGVFDLEDSVRHSPSAPAELPKMELETARTWVIRNLLHRAFMLHLIFTYHSITQTVTGTISGSGSGTVNVYLHNKATGELLGSSSRSGNGSYSITCYDDTVTKFVDAYEDATHTGRSTDGTT